MSTKSSKLDAMPPIHGMPESELTATAAESGCVGRLPDRAPTAAATPATLAALERTVLEAMARGEPQGVVLERLCRLVEHIVPDSMASVMQLDSVSGQLRIRAGPSFPPEVVPYFSNIEPGATTGSCGNAALCGETVIVDDVANDPRWSALRELAARFGIGACWSTPLFTDQRSVAGTFAITSLRPRSPTAEQLRALETASWLGGLALRNEQNEQRLRLWTTAMEHASEGVIIADADGIIVDSNRACAEITGFPLSQLRGRNLHAVKLAAQDDAMCRAIWSAVESSGHWRGELWMQRQNGETYPEWLSISAVLGDGSLPCHYVLVFSDISALKASEQRLFELAHHDSLTRLPNRLRLMQMLEGAVARTASADQTLAVLFIDLDRFKNINDSLGHSAGDALLIEAAARLLDHAGPQGTVARLGGDEFVLLIEGAGDKSDIEARTHRIVADMGAPFVIDDHEVVVTASIGISRFPQDGTEPDRLLRNADIALYRAKRDGRNRYAFYRPGMGQRVRRRLSLESGARHALRRDELVLHYQPQVDSFSGLIVGTEALLRWQHPQLGLLHPAQFLPILEDTRLIVDYGEWVMQGACEQAAAWEAAGAGAPRIGVNLSRLQLLPGRLAAALRGILDASGVDPARIELEITEHGVIEQGDAAIACLRELREVGVGLAIDDFGAGYSSLARLKQLPVDRIKIDRSLVHDVGLDQDAEAICAAVVALGHALGVSVTAEGVETEIQASLLRLIHCDELQGFLYGRPVSAAAFAELLFEQEGVPRLSGFPR